ncbi:MAG: Flp pilus assembly complex ATPase component TadA [Magnetococcales bacterium]|nr:Flp pilus assembly complex ATPase component TadA [Magnetococcales bacterium]
MNTERKPLGVLLEERGLIRNQHVKYALQEQKVTGEKMGEVLERMGFVTQFDVASLVADQAGIRYLDVDRVVPDKEALRVFNKNLCVKNDFLPIKLHEDHVEVVSAATNPEMLIQTIQRHSASSKPPILHQGERRKIQQAIQHYYYFLENPIEKLIEKEIAQATLMPDSAQNLDSLLSHMFTLAIRYRTSDIHIRPGPLSIAIAFRIDGMMHPMFSLNRSLMRLVATIKMRAKMDLAEQRKPQDGRFSITVLDMGYDVRVSTLVCPHGENVVMRILPRDIGVKGLGELGFEASDVERLRQLFNEPYGIVLLTGPTGSGKTTTLYAGIQAQDVIGKNVLTVENPIEYQIPSIRQTEVNVKSGYGFANAIPHFLRHDPDIIMLGEIRDEDTARTALIAAETGHVVLSTLHTNDVFGAIPRLLSLGVSHVMLADSLLGVVSQRLVRRICSNCKESYAPTNEERAILGDHELTTLYRGRGCDSCNETGYIGRVPIYEIWRISEEVTASLARGETMDRIISLAKQGDYNDIRSIAVGKVLTGETTSDELIRILGRGASRSQTRNSADDQIT